MKAYKSASAGKAVQKGKKIRSSKRAVRFTALVILFGGAMLFLNAMMVPAKAFLSVVLIERAWDQTLRAHAQIGPYVLPDGYEAHSDAEHPWPSQDSLREANVVRPWPWMDSQPVAKLEIPKLHQSHIVMSGVSGSTLAFAPGWHEGTSKPGSAGISLISAHKDTHFQDLKSLQAGNVIRLQTQNGVWKTYAVDGFRIVENPQVDIDMSDDESVLVLSTCYPFSNWQLGGSMRYVVIAKEIHPSLDDNAEPNALPDRFAALSRF